MIPPRPIPIPASYLALDPNFYLDQRRPSFTSNDLIHEFQRGLDALRDDALAGEAAR